MSSKKRKFNDLENQDNSNSSKKIVDEEIPSKKQNVQLKPILKKNKNQNTIEVEESKEEKKDELYDTEFEDEYDDEYEDEIIVAENLSEEQEQHEDEAEEPSNRKKITFEEEKEGKGKSKKTKPVPFIGNSKSLDKDEFLDFENKAYEMLHRANTEWPCLSFDTIIPEYESYDFKVTKPVEMNSYPYTLYLVSGTQSTSHNQIYLIKMTELYKTKYDDDSEEESDEENNDVDKEAEIYLSSIEVKHSINRIRSMNHSPLIATWNENGEVEILNVTKKFEELKEKNKENPNSKKKKKNKNQKPSVKIFKNSSEGFAINWNPLKKGNLITGSCDRKIFLYTPVDETCSDFIRQEHPYIFHDNSVEDVHFSPIEEFAFASCSVDKTVRICDTRVGKMNQAQMTIQAHDSDVNVISWNKVNPVLLASGADDGCFKIWDLRFSKEPVTEMQWHTEAITSIYFQPDDESVVTVASADNRISTWDFAVEPDEKKDLDEEEIPDQLIFLHQGQEDIKEIMYHPLYSELILSTSNTGFHAYKPNFKTPENGSDSEEEEDEKNIPKIREEDLDKYLEKISTIKANPMGNSTFCGIFPHDTNICITSRSRVETPDLPKSPSAIKKGLGNHYMEDSLKKKMDFPIERHYSVSFAVEKEGEEKERNFSVGEFGLNEKWIRELL